MRNILHQKEALEDLKLVLETSFKTVQKTMQECGLSIETQFDFLCLGFHFH